MRLEQLEYVAAVARLGSFRRAADELHISQPALSGSVRSLERELGVDLLNRAGTGRGWATRGASSSPHILTLLDAFDRLKLAANEQHGAYGWSAWARSTARRPHCWPRPSGSYGRATSRPRSK